MFQGQFSDLNAGLSFFLVQLQDCQMVYFQTKIPILGKFWMVLKWKVLVYFMALWSVLRTWVARWFIFKPKSQFWVNFGWS
jgi:hypothetical protein